MIPFPKTRRKSARSLSVGASPTVTSMIPRNATVENMYARMQKEYPEIWVQMQQLFDLMFRRHYTPSDLNTSGTGPYGKYSLETRHRMEMDSEYQKELVELVELMSQQQFTFTSEEEEALVGLARK